MNADDLISVFLAEGAIPWMIHAQMTRQQSLNDYSVNKLPNGLLSVFHRPSKLVGTYNQQDNSHVHGDLRLQPHEVARLRAHHGV